MRTPKVHATIQESFSGKVDDSTNKDQAFNPTPVYHSGVILVLVLAAACFCVSLLVGCYIRFIRVFAKSEPAMITCSNLRGRF